MIRDLDQLEDVLDDVLDGIVIVGADYDAPGATGLSRLDRSAELTHLGVRADFPSGENAELLPDADEAWVEEDVSVVLRYQLRASGQMESRRRAHRLERLIRLAFTGYSELQPLHPRYVGSARQWLEGGGWYEVVQTFRLHLDVEVR